MEPEFYVGYAPRAPGTLGRFIRTVAGVCIGLGAALALVLAGAQNVFAPSQFQFGRERTWTGVLVTEPVPMLLNGRHSYLLSGPGKHRVSGMSSDMSGHAVELRGSLVQHGSDEMIEVVPDGIVAGNRMEVPERVRLGHVSLTGEIVDSKCYLGVMNPGRGKVHRDCAVRCISGGIPAALLARDATNALSTFVLTSADGTDLAPHLLPMIAEPVRISGELFRVGSRLLLETRKKAIVRVNPE